VCNVTTVNKLDQSVLSNVFHDLIFYDMIIKQKERLVYNTVGCIML